MQQVNHGTIRQLSFYAILVFLGVFLFLKLDNFLPALLGSVTMYVLLDRPLYYLIDKKKWNRRLAVISLMLASFIIVLLPISLFIDVLFNKIDYAAQHSKEVVSGLKLFLSNIERDYHFTLISDHDIENTRIAFTQMLPKLLGATFNSLFTVVVMYFLLYFLLVNNREMEAWLYKNVPLRNENIKLVGGEVQKLVMSNALGIPITAILQGTIGALSY